MKYITILLFLTSCSLHSETKKTLMKDCFDSGGDEFHYDPGVTVICVYKSNSCRLDK